MNSQPALVAASDDEEAFSAAPHNATDSELNRNTETLAASRRRRRRRTRSVVEL